MGVGGSKVTHPEGSGLVEQGGSGGSDTAHAEKGQ